MPHPAYCALVFLCGIADRAAICLPTFYLYVGAELCAEVTGQVGYAHRVRTSALRISAISTLALSVRAVFDCERKGFTAKTLLRLDDRTSDVLVARLTRGNPSKEEGARRTLDVVKSVLRRCAIPISEAKKSECILAGRVALMRAYADRRAAHISLGNYELGLLDVMHPVAAMAIIGATTDALLPSGSADAWKALDELDEAAYESARELFPALGQLPRLFIEPNFRQTLKSLFFRNSIDVAEFLAVWLPSAVGWDHLPKELSSVLKVR